MNIFAPPRIAAFVADDHTLAAGSPECVVPHDDSELPVRYEVLRDSSVVIKAVKVSGFWHDPAAFGFSESAVRVWEGACLAIERDLASEQ